MLEGTQKVHFPTCMCSCHRNLSWKYSFPAALQFRISRKSSNLSERLCLDSCVPLVCLSKPTLISQSPFRPRVCSSSSRLSWLFLALFQSLAINFTLQWGALVTVQRRRERKPHRLASQRQYLIVFTNNNLPIIASAPSPPLHRRGWVYSLNCWR